MLPEAKEATRHARSVRPINRKNRFIGQIGRADSTIQLLSSLADIYFFMKDRRGRFVAGNLRTLEKLGLGREEDLIGKTDYDFFVDSMADGYVGDDNFVMKNGRPVENRIELVANPDGSFDWHVTNKSPLLSDDGTVIGVIGIMRDLNHTVAHSRHCRRLARAIAYIAEHYNQNIKIGTLANRAGLSLGRFEKLFKTAFRTTPKNFLIRYRITQSCNDLVGSERRITDISVKHGFYDHSHFSREFKRLIGMSPGEYRKHHSL